ncbi:MAG: DUF975 family protein [Clostridiales Family XIII bacterium]|jgi:uncharacterized membrane protein|nr:DUF975 family protein [Clostridiales Family XIII bacterium]
MKSTKDTTKYTTQENTSPITIRNLKTIRDLKKEAKVSMRRNYAACMMIVIVLSILIVGLPSISRDIDASSSIIKSFDIKPINKELTKIEKGLSLLQKDTNIGKDSKRGVIHDIYTKTMSVGNLGLAAANNIDKAIFANKLSTRIINLLSVLPTLAFAIFVKYMLIIGRARFFLETRKYSATPIGRVTFVYRVYGMMSVVRALFWKVLWLVIWTFTIVGLPIKLYSYSMVEYILAENPKVGAREALQLSKAMTKGYKRKVFLLDLSFLPWLLLGLVTFCITRYTYSDILYYASKAEMYAELRGLYLARTDKLACAETSLKDTYLFCHYTETENENQYPRELYFLRRRPDINALRYDYKRNYSPENIILMFFIFSFIGYVWEVFLAFLTTGQFINRGSMYGPWIPIYGAGGIAMLLLLRKFIDRPIVTFFLTMVVAGLIEYISATYIYMTTGLEYWSYKGYFFNIQGRVSLEGLLAFGLLGCGGIYLFAPVADHFLNKISRKIRLTIMTILLVCFLTDGVIVHFHPHTGYDITSDLNQ